MIYFSKGNGSGKNDNEREEERAQIFIVQTYDISTDGVSE